METDRDEESTEWDVYEVLTRRERILKVGNRERDHGQEKLLVAVRMAAPRT
jgi:hypothetical protein